MNNTLNINSVDLDKIKSFTQEHINKIIANNKDTHPELYKENKYGKLIVIKAVDLKDIKWRGGVQTSQVGGARYAGGNPRHKEVENSIKQKGWKLKNPPIFLQQLEDGLYPMTGHTRAEIALRLDVTNIPAAIFKMHSESDASIFSVKLNAPADPSGPFELKDVKLELTRAYLNKWIEFDPDNQIKSLQVLAKRFDEIAEGQYSTNKKNAAIQQVLSNVSETGVVHQWQSLEQTKVWMQQNKYINTDKIKYLPVASSTISKAMFKAAQVSANNPGCEIRVCPHTGTLEGYDLMKNYNHKVNKFKEDWNTNLSNFKNQFFSTNTDECKITYNNNIVLYGALPALDDHHNMEKLVMYKR